MDHQDWDTYYVTPKKSAPQEKNKKQFVKSKEQKMNEKEEEGKLSSGAKDPCQKGYKMVGMKDKNGKQVPNCVPK